MGKMIFQKSKLRLILGTTLLTSALVISGCAPQSSPAIDNASKTISDSLGCTNVRSKVFDAFYEMIDSTQSIPSADSLKDQVASDLERIFSNKRLSSADSEKAKQLKVEIDKLIDLLLTETRANPQLTWKEQIQKLIEYEMEDRSAQAIIQSTQDINAQVDVITDLSQSLDLSCKTQQAPAPDTSAPTPDGPATPAPDSSMPPLSPTTPPSSGTDTFGMGSAIPMMKGLKMVFTTAYQSCRVWDLPAMTAATASVVGISRVGTHEDGIGGVRIISDLTSVQNTHYYIRGIATESQCASVRNNPLIYDYGGSPVLSGNTINFQKNAGSGSNALGVDCSAYVSSAIAVAGLRYKPSLENKPIYIRQTSGKFIDAATSGFTCFDNISVDAKTNIKPGDIVGVSGHVVAVDRVGVDPFGIKLLRSSSECSTLDYRKFDITVTQSSPSKNGIGINRFEAKDYLAESSKMKTAFVEMGKQACLAYFQNKTIKPKSSAWGFLRHKGTPECLAPRVTLVGESCTQKCF